MERSLDKLLPIVSVAGAAAAALLSCCGWFSDEPRTGRPSRAERPEPGRELLGIAPAGAPILVWANVARARRWSEKEGTYKEGSDEEGKGEGKGKGKRGRDGSVDAAIERFERIVGFDPLAHLRQVVGTATLHEGGLRWFILLDGEGIREKLRGRLDAMMGVGAKGRVTRYGEARLVRSTGATVGYLGADLVVSGPDVLVRRCVDLERKRPDESVRKQKGLMGIWKALSGSEWAGRPALLAAVEGGEWMTSKLTGKWQPLGAVERWGARLQLGEWVQLVVLASLSSRRRAATFVHWLHGVFDDLAGTRWMRLLRLDRYTRFLHVHNEGPMVYIQLTVPKKEVLALLQLVRSLGFSASGGPGEGGRKGVEGRPSKEPRRREPRR